MSARSRQAWAATAPRRGFASVLPSNYGKCRCCEKTEGLNAHGYCQYCYHEIVRVREYHEAGIHDVPDHICRKQSDA
jgi:hypothetical protein